MHIFSANPLILLSDARCPKEVVAVVIEALMHGGMCLVPTMAMAMARPLAAKVHPALDPDLSVPCWREYRRRRRIRGAHAGRHPTPTPD